MGTDVRPASAVGASIDTSTIQRAHYDRIAERYELHYSDEWSQRYRLQFINQALTRGLDLEGREVLDAMCGSGQMAEYLAGRGATVTGIDVSPEVIYQFKSKLPTATGVEGSIFQTDFDDGHFDHVFVVGGLHHVHPNVDRAVEEIHRILKPGGCLCFAEPHANSIVDLGRRLWYRFDPLFESNEAGVDVDHMEACHSDRFEILTKRYTGALAYLLVYNSLIFRVPLSWKRLYAPLALHLEALVEPLQRAKTSCMVLAQWRKRFA